MRQTIRRGPINLHYLIFLKKHAFISDKKDGNDKIEAMNNILFILTDQWPAWAFSFRGADIPTPNIDRLASEGTVFNNAFTSCPLCTPARATLLTFRWPHQNGVYDNQSVGYSLQQSMPLDQKTWIEEAVSLGYHVGYYGKWHLGHINPEKHGAHGYDPNLEVRLKPYHPQTSDHCYQKTVDNYDTQTKSLIRGMDCCNE